MISRQSIKWYCLINGLLFTLATVQYHIPWFILVKNPVLLFIVSMCTKHKPSLHGHTIEHSGMRHYWPYLPYILQSTILDTTTHVVLTNWIVPPSNAPILNELLWFIPASFMFELVFDFFHYWTHRFEHSSKWIYRNIHGLHHSTQHLHAPAAFKHHILDLLISNTAPLILAVWLTGLSEYTFIAIGWYKTLQEIGGHSGKLVRSSGFCQCKWIPEMLGIGLYSRNHNEHHKNPCVNFSKRFSLWDRVFGTFHK